MIFSMHRKEKLRLVGEIYYCIFPMWTKTGLVVVYTDRYNNDNNNNPLTCLHCNYMRVYVSYAFKVKIRNSNICVHT